MLGVLRLLQEVTSLSEDKYRVEDEGREIKSWAIRKEYVGKGAVVHDTTKFFKLFLFKIK